MIQTLIQTRDQILTLCEGLSVEKANSRPIEGGWTISEVMEHLAVSERGSLIGIKRTLGRPEANPELLKETIGKTELIETRIPSVLRKVSAPEMVLPTGRFKQWPEALHAFLEVRLNTIQMAESADEALDNRVMLHAILGPLTLRQWLYFTVAHTQRHTRQIEAVFAHIDG